MENNDRYSPAMMKAESVTAQDETDDLYGASNDDTIICSPDLINIYFVLVLRFKLRLLRSTATFILRTIAHLSLGSARRLGQCCSRTPNHLER